MNLTLCAAHLAGSGGQEKFLRTVCRFLIDKGHHVRILAAASDPIPGANWTSVHPVRLPLRGARDWQIGNAIARRLKTEPPGLVFGAQKMWCCHVLRLGGGIEREFWRRRTTGLPGVSPIRRLAYRLSLKRRLDLDAERRGLDFADLDRIIVNSKQVLAALARDYPHRASRAVVIYNGVDTDRFRPAKDPTARASRLRQLGMDPQEPTAVFSGHNFVLKGLPQAMAAMAAARAIRPETRLQLIVLGHGRPAPMLKIARKLGIEDRVRFVGDVTTPGDYYATADFLVLPTFYDPCANVTLEAMACGIPVITTRDNGASELITGPEEGFVVAHPGARDAIAESMLRFSAMVGKKEILPNAPRQKALHHKMADSLAAIEQVLLETAERKSFVAHSGRHAVIPCGSAT